MYLVGGGGVRNYGDELIISSWIRWYEQTFGEAYLEGSTVAGTTVHSLQRTLSGPMRTQLRLSNRLRNVGKRLVQERQIGFFDALSAGMSLYDDESLLGAVGEEEVTALLGANRLHLHGGGYLNDKWPWHAFTFGALVATQKRTGSKLLGTGLGLGPYSRFSGSNRELMAEAVSAFDLFSVRDLESERILAEAGITAPFEFGLDDSFVQPIEIIPRSGSCLHIALYSSDLALKLIDRLPRSFVDSFDEHYFWICAPGDAELFARLARRFHAFEPLSQRALVEWGVPYGAAGNYMYTTRFHPHLVGYRLGMSGSYRAEGEYYRAKHQSVVDLGSPFQQRLVGDLSADTARDALGSNASGPRDDPIRVAQKRMSAISGTLA